MSIVSTRSSILAWRLPLTREKICNHLHIIVYTIILGSCMKTHTNFTVASREPRLTDALIWHTAVSPCWCLMKCRIEGKRKINVTSCSLYTMYIGLTTTPTWYAVVTVWPSPSSITSIHHKNARSWIISKTCQFTHWHCPGRLQYPPTGWQPLEHTALGPNMCVHACLCVWECEFNI